MDNFREWLSDNLRYFMLGGAILIIVAVLFFGIRACTRAGRGNAEDDQMFEEIDTAANEENQDDTPSSVSNGENNEKNDENPLESNNQEISTLIEKYYQAMGDKDIDTLKTLVNHLSPSDESLITGTDYIVGYEVKDAFYKKGPADGTYVVFAEFSYLCSGNETSVPGLSQLYVVTEADGSLKIDADIESDPEVSSYISEILKDDDVKALQKEVQDAYDKTLEENPTLSAYLSGLGEETAVTPEPEAGETMTATDDCNIREAADGQSDVIGGVPYGEEVLKIGEEGEWIRIQYDGITGYVYHTLLEYNE